MHVIWTHCERYWIPRLQSASEAATREKMRRKSPVGCAHSDDGGQSVADETLDDGLADRLAISASDIEFEMFGPNSDPGPFSDREVRRGRNLEAVADLDPGEALASTQDAPVGEIRHAHDSRDFG